MLKWIVFGILALGAIMAVPRVRQRVAPHFAPVTSRVKPLSDKVTTPAKRWSAKNEASALLHRLAEDDAQNKELPTPSTFQHWIRTSSKGGASGKDPWGRPYYMVNEKHQITIGSAGPDLKRSTPDDIRVSAPVH